jgi:hypothetical protein
MNLELLLALLVGLVAGAVVGLKVIAPLTSNKVDDAVLKRLEALEELLKKLQG